MRWRSCQCPAPSWVRFKIIAPSCKWDPILDKLTADTQGEHLLGVTPIDLQWHAPGEVPGGDMRDHNFDNCLYGPNLLVRLVLQPLGILV